MRPNIAIVSALSAAPWGAAEELWQQTALALNRRGYRVAASVTRWPQRPDGVERLLAEGVAVEEREQGLGELWRAPDVDLVLLQQPDLFAAEPWMTACREAGIAYATLSHYAAEHEWPPGSTALSLRAGYRNATMNYFVSQANADLAERQTAQTLARRKIVRNPFKTSWDAPFSWPEDDGTLRLACVARLDLEDKAQDILCHVLARPEWRARPVSLSLIGEGPHRDLIAAMIGELRLDEVRLVGRREDIDAVWRDHHVLVLPSRAEGLPIVLVEALLAGRPAVVSDVAGNGELLEDGATGFLAAAPTDAAFAVALERLWQARDRLEAMGRRAAREIRTRIPAEPDEAFADELCDLARSLEG